MEGRKEMGNELTIEMCQEKFDEAVEVVRQNVDVVRQAFLFSECLKFLKKAADVLKRLRKEFNVDMALAYCVSLDVMINDVIERGVAKVNA